MDCVCLLCFMTIISLGHKASLEMGMSWRVSGVCRDGARRCISSDVRFNK